MSVEAIHIPRATSRPVEWDALMPEEGERIPWQVWTRKKGPGYWLMRWATKVSRLLGEDVSNPNGIEEPATFWTEEEAKDLCRIIHRETKGRYAVTYGPVVVGRVHPLKSVKAVGDKRFDPFKTYDFSATDAVKEQARHILVDVEDWRRILSDLTDIRDIARPPV